jgi:dipeptidyl aminopeptidase/acylaminoacyl peptidase
MKAGILNKNLKERLRFLLSLVCLWAIGICLSSFYHCKKVDVPEEVTLREEDVNLIPLKTLFSPASIVAPRLSPDGSMISYIAPHNGVPNFFVMDVGNPESKRPLTEKKVRGVQASNVSGNVMYRWSIDSKFILFPEDYNGDENWDIHRIDVQTGEEKNLTPMEGVKVQMVQKSAKDPETILITINDRNKFFPDLYRLNIKNGERELVERNEHKFFGYLADYNLRPRGAVGLRPDGGYKLLKSAGDGQWESFFEIPYEDRGGLNNSIYQDIIRIDKTNRYLYMYDYEGRNTTALVRYDLETGEKTEVATDDKTDLFGVLYHPVSFEPQAYATNWTRMEWNFLDASLRQDFDYLAKVADGDYRVESRSDDDQKWLVRYTISDAPETYYLYDRTKGKADKLFTTTPQLEGLTLSKLHPYVMKSRDGFDLVSYLSLPVWSDPDDDGRPDKPLPTVMLVHGGPSDERAQYAFGPILQWFTNRGYAVLYVNYRGSPGFGKTFLNAQNLEWGGKMHDDLVDQVEWAVAEGIAIEDKVGIIGGSYGGYATLVGMTMTPEVFACGVDLVGPSNLEIFMPHWNVDIMSKIVGDPRTEEGRAHLKSRSPINFAHQTKNPLLIGQGANDSRVPQDQSDSMVKVMVENGAKVTYALFPDEGHGLYRPENSYAFWAITEVFLGVNLGGRFMPIMDELEGSSIQVIEGAEHVPGLTEALAERNNKVN